MNEFNLFIVWYI